jgi:LysM repeat protein
VQPGDNLYRIALKYQVSFAALIRLNDITYPDYIIHVGQRLCIP